MTAYQLWSMGDELELYLFAYCFTVTLSYHAIKTACSPQGDHRVTTEWLEVGALLHS